MEARRAETPRSGGLVHDSLTEGRARKAKAIDVHNR